MKRGVKLYIGLAFMDKEHKMIEGMDPTPTLPEYGEGNNRIDDEQQKV